jgi:hypothetical protein
MTVREIAARVATEYRLDMGLIAANVVVATVRAALARPHEGVIAEKRGQEPMAYHSGLLTLIGLGVSA